MRLTVIERLVPHDKIVHNKPGRDEQIENFKTLLRNMGKAGMSTLCYNWYEVLAQANELILPPPR